MTFFRSLSEANLPIANAPPPTSFGIFRKPSSTLFRPRHQLSPYSRLLEDPVTSSSASSSDRYYSLSSSSDEGATPRIDTTVGAAFGTAPPAEGRGSATWLCSKTADEAIDTERAYLDDLWSVIEGYLKPTLEHGPSLGITSADVGDLFGNLEELYNFNESFYQRLRNCRNNPGAMARCFVEGRRDFCRHYQKYCQNYPRSIAILSPAPTNGGSPPSLRFRPLLSFLRTRQTELGHTLPLTSYLLKPVQRILKYPLILKNLERHLKDSDPNDRSTSPNRITSANRISMERALVQSAYQSMSTVASRINESRKRLENEEKITQLANDMAEWPGRGRDPRTILADLSSLGELILDGCCELLAPAPLIPYPRKRSKRKVRHLFLFQKGLLISKKSTAAPTTDRASGTRHTFKDAIPCHELEISESFSIPGDTNPLTCFTVVTTRRPVVPNRPWYYTFKCASESQKSTWITSFHEVFPPSCHVDRSKSLYPTPPHEFGPVRPPRHSSLDARKDHVIDGDIFANGSVQEPSTDTPTPKDSQNIELRNVSHSFNPDATSPSHQSLFSAPRNAVIDAVDLATKALSSFQRFTSVRRSIATVPDKASDKKSQFYIPGLNYGPCVDSNKFTAAAKRTSLPVAPPLTKSSWPEASPADLINFSPPRPKSFDPDPRSADGTVSEGTASRTINPYLMHVGSSSPFDLPRSTFFDFSPRVNDYLEGVPRTSNPHPKDSGPSTDYVEIMSAEILWAPANRENGETLSPYHKGVVGSGRDGGIEPQTEGSAKVQQQARWSQTSSNSSTYSTSSGVHSGMSCSNVSSEEGAGTLVNNLNDNC